MKKILFSLVLLFSMSTLFSQKTINNPEYGLQDLPGEITKIELTTDATILHFYIKYSAGDWIFIPKKSYIRDSSGDQKLFVTHAEGIPLEKKYTMPESGEVRYQLYFPKLDNTVNTIDFGEANKGGSWMVFDIVLNEANETSQMPKELRGSWLLTDGSNQWDYGFYAKNAIVDKAVWNYKTVTKEKNNYVIVLERNGNQKTIYAQIDKKRAILFGSDKKQMKSYSTAKTENSKYKIPNDEPYSELIFKTDSATYSGVIKGYTPRAKKKTGTIAVNNVFTSEHDSYLVKIADDGSFSVKFPINHPQFILVQLPYFSDYVFVEPGKEIFQLLDQKKPLFMGDVAKLNTDLNMLVNIFSYADYSSARENILEKSPQEYKNACLKIKNKQMEVLNSLPKKQFLSQKAIQIIKLDIEYDALVQMLSFEMNKERVNRKDKSVAISTGSNPEKEYKLDSSYFDFITEPILNNEIAIVSNQYLIFINRLKYNSTLLPWTVSFATVPYYETIEKLQKSGTIFSKDELEMIEEGKKVDIGFNRINDFKLTYNKENAEFRQNHKTVFEKLQLERPEAKISLVEVADYLSENGIPLSSSENELISAFKTVNFTKEDLQIQEQFTLNYKDLSKTFREKFQTKFLDIRGEILFNKINDRLNEVFGIKESFVYDIFTSQDKLQELDQYSIPYSESKLQWIQDKINNSNLSNYIVFENDKLKAKIEANKKETGFTINTLKKSEGDDLFESMIAKFKGKVIYVDFWATWCGPCMQGIKEIAPLKEEMKNENVVFLYITNQTSPEKTWNAKIPNIKGEHYRVTDDEWNYLTQKFNISGIPHYVLVNKKGEIIKPKFRHSSIEELKGVLEKELK